MTGGPVEADVRLARALADIGDSYRSATDEQRKVSARRLRQLARDVEPRPDVWVGGDGFGGAVDRGY